MTSLCSTIPMEQPQRSFRFLSYTGPPEPKPGPRRSQLKKVPPSDDEYPNIDEFLGEEPGSNSVRGNEEDLVRAAHGVGVVDSTCSADNEANYEIYGSGRGSGGVGSVSSTNEREDVSMATTQEASHTTPFRGSSEEDVIVINDSDDDRKAKGDDQSGSTCEPSGSAREGLFMIYESLNQGSNTRCSTVEFKPKNNDRQTYTPIDSDDNGGNRSVRAEIGSRKQESPSAAIPKPPSEECSIGPHNVIGPKSNDSRAHRSVSVPQQGLGFAPQTRAVSESLYLTSSDGEAQDAQPRKIERVVDQSKPLPFANTGPV
ncbi:uncharacterized protein CC84DRAFT_1264876 [Paraphaeosphaeria sporulosa]|uniref:Uncharacterized protein n=1 Tax=Paraphaeosphaeria sporulosa TaxID=1460663 RepID=A0A177BW14_9PLEO|nr:uncharacterized protein CC84DRAFT_1264876 [Paraphaeosphaeria sporulosa]OAF98556.1 hypothetical protein CC84DRAFT_1264876 [Paraphaeosphaeria sporulosa]